MRTPVKAKTTPKKNKKTRKTEKQKNEKQTVRKLLLYTFR